MVTTPGWRPGTPLLTAAAAAGIPVIGDVELAWRLRPVLADGSRQDWLAVTGTNGKTTTVQMLAAMLAAAGHRSVAAGNVGLSVVDAIGEPEPYRVLAVELSSFQLYWSQSVRPAAAVVLNVAAHHLDWHGDIESYAQAKGRVYAPGTVAVCNAEDARSHDLAAAAASYARRVVASGSARPGRMSSAWPATSCWTGRLAVPTARRASSWPESTTSSRRPRTTWPTRSPRRHWPGRTASRRRRSRPGWPGSGPTPHRMSLVAHVGGVDYVDDSKASNPHAAAASLAAYPSVVWIAGGLFRGADADIDSWSHRRGPRLRGVVLLGADRDVISRSLARHAPDVPVVEAVRTDTGAMDLVVAEAARAGRARGHRAAGAGRAVVRHVPGLPGARGRVRARRSGGGERRLAR